MKTLLAPLALVAALGIATPAAAQLEVPTGNRAHTRIEGICYVEYRGVAHIDGTCIIAFGEKGFTINAPGERDPAAFVATVAIDGNGEKAVALIGATKPVGVERVAKTPGGNWGNATTKIGIWIEETR